MIEGENMRKIDSPRMHEAPIGEWLQAGVFKHKKYKSISPKMHTAGYEALEIDRRFRYDEFNLESPDELARKIEEMRDPDKYWVGASIGAPHKQDVMQHLDHIDNAATSIGAVNTVVVERDGNIRLVGTNTDWLGFTRALGEKVPDLGSKKTIAIVGAGGASRASLFALREMSRQMERAFEITIFNRTIDRAEELASQFGADRVYELNLNNLDQHNLDEFDIIVQATSASLPEIAAHLRKEQVVVEWKYSREVDQTELERIALQKGATVVSGRRIVLGQAFRQFKLFTGFIAPEKTMESAL